MKFLEIFNEITKGDFGLTEEAIYSSINNGDEMIPLWGGNKHHRTCERMVSISATTKNGSKIAIFSGKGIIISLDGSAGSMTYKCNEKFALNHHAGFITLRKKSSNSVDLEYFALFYQNFYRSLSVSEGSKTLSLQQIYKEEFELPTYETQLKIMKQLKPFCKKIQTLDSIKSKIEIDLMEKEILSNIKKYQVMDIPISSVIDYMSGNSGLTEETIYIAAQRQGVRYEVLSSATEDRTKMGEVPIFEINGKLIKVFEDQEGLLVTRNGKAGRSRYLTSGKYTINDHAYILFVKNNCPYKISLKWLSIQYRSQFLEYASSSDNGTWNMTGFFKNVVIDIPYMEEQLKLINLWGKADMYLNHINSIQFSFNNLLLKEIVLI
jgi:restriction endonuclease S subunit